MALSICAIKSIKFADDTSVAYHLQRTDSLQRGGEAAGVLVPGQQSPPESLQDKSDACRLQRDAGASLALYIIVFDPLTVTLNCIKHISFCCHLPYSSCPPLVPH